MIKIIELLLSSKTPLIAYSVYHVALLLLKMQDYFYLDRKDYFYLDRKLILLVFVVYLSAHDRANMYWISINDVNDEPPRFNRNLGNYSVEIPENLEVGKDTGINLKVDDKDEGICLTFVTC